MGSFANSVFSVLLGWIRAAVNQLWRMLDSDEGGGMLAWIGENWLTLTVVLCAVGLIVDGVVYVLRWRPFQVWASFFRRLRGEGVEADEWTPPAPAEEMQPESVPAPTQTTGPVWVYPDGTARVAEGYEAPQGEVVTPGWEERNTYQPPAPEAPMFPAAQFFDEVPAEAAPVSPYARPMPPEQPMQYAAVGRSYRRPRAERGLYVPEARPATVPDLTGLEDYPQPPEELRPLEPYEPPMAEVVELPADEPSQPPQPLPRRVLARVRQNLAGDPDEPDYHYTPPQPAVDKRQAYRKPVYPPAWRPPEAREEQEVNSPWS